MRSLLLCIALLLPTSVFAQDFEAKLSGIVYVHKQPHNKKWKNACIINGKIFYEGDVGMVVDGKLDKMQLDFKASEQAGELWDVAKVLPGKVIVSYKGKDYLIKLNPPKKDNELLWKKKTE